MNTKYIGNTRQLFDVRPYTFSDGRSASTRAVDVWNGANLHFTILADRNLDLYTMRYRNNNMSFLTPNGVVAPQYYNDATAGGWLRSFAGGFFVTCGLQSIGDTDASDPDLSVHGRIYNTPSENFSIKMADDGLSADISGTMYETILCGVKLRLSRTISCKAGVDEIKVTDKITNLGWQRAPISILYHFNMGYPLLTEKSKIYIPAVKTLPRNEHAKLGLKEWDKVLKPQPNFEEMCYYHTLSENCFGVDNKEINTRLRISFESDGLLDRLVQWRMFNEGDYVMGFEPASCTLEGREDAVKNGSQKYIDAQATLQNSFVIKFTELNA